jgi:hypothetical protein
MGHRRFLPIDHPWRNNKSSFDNTREVRHAPQPLTGDDVIAQHENIQPVMFGKTIKIPKQKEGEKHKLKKKSSFF